MKVKNWLMDVQEYAFDMLQLVESTKVRPELAKTWFLTCYPQHERVFDDCKTEWDRR